MILFQKKFLTILLLTLGVMTWGCAIPLPGAAISASTSSAPAENNCSATNRSGCPDSTSCALVGGYWSGSVCSASGNDTYCQWSHNNSAHSFWNGTSCTSCDLSIPGTFWSTNRRECYNSEVCITRYTSGGQSFIFSEGHLNDSGSACVVHQFTPTCAKTYLSGCDGWTSWGEVCWDYGGNYDVTSGDCLMPLSGY